MKGLLFTDPKNLLGLVPRPGKRHNRLVPAADNYFKKLRRRRLEKAQRDLLASETAGQA